VFGCCQIGSGCASPVTRQQCAQLGGEFFRNAVCGPQGVCITVHPTPRPRPTPAPRP
jgi:hypothetical protein